MATAMAFPTPAKLKRKGSGLNPDLIGIDATPGQKAMATAMAFPEAKRGRGNIDPAKCASESHFSQKTLERARYVLRNNPIPEGQNPPFPRLPDAPIG